MKFWPTNDEHMCSKHVETWNKLILKQKFCAPSWLITEKIILRCTVSETSKFSELIRYVNFGAVAACRVFVYESYTV